MPGPIVTLRQMSVWRGLLGSSRGWRALGITLWSFHLLRRLLGRNPELVAIERLKPGQSMVVTALVPESTGRRARRAARR